MKNISEIINSYFYKEKGFGQKKSQEKTQFFHNILFKKINAANQFLPTYVNRVSSGVYIFFINNVL